MGHIKSIASDHTTTYYTDSKLQYFGDDGSTFLKRPLSIEANWTDDYVCVGDLCSDFRIGDVSIIYPFIPTTTTQYPFTATLTVIENNSTVQPILNGYYGITSYGLIVSPAILPGYNVTVDLNFISKLYITGGTNNESDSVITIKKNGSQIYNVSHQIYNVNSNNITNNTSLVIGNGDNIEIILENTAIKSPSSPIGIVSSATQMTVSVPINGVQPNGSIPVIVPPITTHNIPTP